MLSLDEWVEKYAKDLEREVEITREYSDGTRYLMIVIREWLNKNCEYEGKNK